MYILKTGRTDNKHDKMVAFLCLHVGALVIFHKNRWQQTTVNCTVSWQLHGSGPIPRQNLVVRVVFNIWVGWPSHSP